MDRVDSFKVINDNIHGPMQFPKVIMKVIDTLQFQRLRFIKQLGGTHFVFPNATHTRFQHSLGVAHLAQNYALHFQRQKPDLVDKKDIICVTIAGLCHDLGHGPFSHMFEDFLKKTGTTWHHETMSIKMFDYLIEDNNIMAVFKENDPALDERDVLFIKEMIAGPINQETGLPTGKKINEDEPWCYEGRDEEKSFLYDIISNKITGIDVDKWDYFVRDDNYLKISHVFEHDRFIMYSRLFKTGPRNRWMICIRDGLKSLIEEMFSDRARLHSQGYQHRVTKIVEHMLIDALLIADEHIATAGTDGKPLTLSQACNDVQAHSMINDDQVFWEIVRSNKPELSKAKAILERILNRDLYRSVIKITTKEGSKLRDVPEDQILDEIRGFVGSTQDSSLTSDELKQEQVRQDEIIIVKRKIDMGMGYKNPVKKCIFFDKNLQIKELPLNDHSPVELIYWICSKRNESRPIKEICAAVDAWKVAKNIQDFVEDVTYNLAQSENM